MYGHSAREALFAILKNAPELVDARIKKEDKPVRITPQRLRRLTDRVLKELWHRGFAVSARTPDDKGDRSPEHHDAWRATKRSPSRTVSEPRGRVRAAGTPPDG